MKTLIRSLTVALLTIALGLFLHGCGGGGGGPSAPAAPTAITPTAGNGQVTLSWRSVAGATSYNIYYGTAAGVTKTTGTQVANAVSPQIVPTLANDTKYFFVVTAVNGIGESTISREVFATPVTFAQADLVGTWNVTIFATGPEVTSGTTPGWRRGTVAIDAAGAVTFLTYLDSSGSTTAPTGVVETINAAGVVTEADPASTFPGNHAVMATNKNIIIGTGTVTTTGSRAIRIFQKQLPAVTFTSTDLSNLPFGFSQLNSGANNEWRVGVGLTDTSQRVSLLALVGPFANQPLPPLNFETLAISPTGIVTATANSINPSFATFQGVMSPDKKVIIATQTDTSGGTTNYNLLVIIVAGQTFTKSDLAGGNFSIHALEGGIIPLWLYGTLSFDSTGFGGFTVPPTASTPVIIPPSITLFLSADGLLSDHTDPSFLGFMSFNKDMIVSTATTSSGLEFNLSIILR